jgi:hypothetical protein
MRVGRLLGEPLKRQMSMDPSAQRILSLKSKSVSYGSSYNAPTAANASSRVPKPFPERYVTAKEGSRWSLDDRWIHIHNFTANWGQIAD